MRRSVFVLVFVLVVVTPALGAGVVDAQSAGAADSLLDRLVGHWVLQGAMAGGEVTHDVTFERVLGREYIRMHEVSSERTAAGAPAYEAIVFISWVKASKQYACLWLDNTEAWNFDPKGIAHAAFAGDSIPFIFRVSDKQVFRTTFAYARSTDMWRWTMVDDSAGVLRPFARVTLTRRP